MESFNYGKTINVLPSVDVLVMGGGPAGLASSVAAARSGAETLLVERFGFLGGNLTAGLVGPCMTSYSVDGTHQLINGIYGEFVDRLVAMGGGISPREIEGGTAWSGYIHTGHSRVTPFEPEAAKEVATSLVQDSGAKTLLHTFAVDTVVEEGRVTGVVLANKAGLSLQPAKVVIDCTGDGDIADQAGVEMVKGREEDGLMQPATVFFRIAGVDDDAVDRWVVDHPEEARPFESIIKPAREAGEYPSLRRGVGMYSTMRPGVWRANTTRVLEVDGTNPWDLTRAEQEGRKQAHALVKFFRENLPGLSNAYLLDTATTVGIRETRRIIGEYVLTGEDLRTGRYFSDTVALCGYPIDIHNPRGAGAPGPDGLVEGSEAAADIYSIPYRTLVPLAVDGLLVAGRCLSSTHEALAAVRIMPPAFALGQAAGIAAALSVQDHTPVRSVNVQVVRDHLRKQNAIVDLPEPVSSAPQGRLESSL